MDHVIVPVRRHSSVKPVVHGRGHLTHHHVGCQTLATAKSKLPSGEDIHQHLHVHVSVAGGPPPVPEQVGVSGHRETGPSDSSDGQPLVRKSIIPPVINLPVPGCTAEVDINCINILRLCSPMINTVAITARDSSTIISDATISTVITGSTLVSRASTSHRSRSK
jgi:hypothetical protein